ncbi:MAG: universal stress protein [bacterium]|nr:universal stress protein [bacterium]
MLNYKKILIPIDFSEHSEFAAKQGISLAQQFKATVFFLHVGDNAERSARRLSKFLQHKIGFEMPVPVKKLVAQGQPVNVILAAARRIHVDCLVMGTRGSSGLKQLVLGSVSEKMLRQSEYPVLILKKREHSSEEYMFPQIRNTHDVFQADKILVPLDFSPASKQALHHALSIASRYSATVYALTVFDKKLKEYGDDREKHTTVIVRGEKIRLWQKFPELLQKIQYNSSQTRLKRMLLPGDPFTKIEGIVEKKEIDLIVMGTHGKSGFENLLVGSVAGKVLRSIDCSVMTVQAGKENL